MPKRGTYCKNHQLQVTEADLGLSPQETCRLLGLRMSQRENLLKKRGKVPGNGFLRMWRFLQFWRQGLPPSEFAAEAKSIDPLVSSMRLIHRVARKEGRAIFVEIALAHALADIADRFVLIEEILRIEGVDPESSDPEAEPDSELDLELTWQQMGEVMEPGVAKQYQRRYLHLKHTTQTARVRGKARKRRWCVDLFDPALSLQGQPHEDVS